MHVVKIKTNYVPIQKLVVKIHNSLFHMNSNQRHHFVVDSRLKRIAKFIPLEYSFLAHDSVLITRANYPYRKIPR